MDKGKILKVISFALCSLIVAMILLNIGCGQNRTPLEQAKITWYKTSIFDGNAREAAFNEWEKLSLKEVEQACTLEQARNSYINAPMGAKSQEIALKKWDNFALEENKKATTIKQVMEIYNDAPKKSGEARRSALRKWIELCVTSQELLDVRNNIYQDNELLKFSQERLDKILAKEALTANTIEEADMILRRSRDNSEARELSLRKIKELLPEELRKASTYDDAMYFYHRFFGDDSEITELIMKKVDKILLKEVEETGLAREMKTIFYNTFKDSESRKVSLEKWNMLSLQEIEEAYDTEEVKLCFDEAPPFSEAQKTALRKWRKLSLEDVQKATTLEEIRESYDNAPRGSEARELALKKMYELFQKEKEFIKSIDKKYNYIPEYKNSGIFLIEKNK